MVSSHLKPFPSFREVIFIGAGRVIALTSSCCLVSGCIVQSRTFCLLRGDRYRPSLDREGRKAIRIVLSHASSQGHAICLFTSMCKAY
jgi:hypothetical protein